MPVPGAPELAAAPAPVIVPGSLGARLAAWVMDQVILVPAAVLVLLWVGVDGVEWQSRELRTWREQLDAVAGDGWAALFGLQLVYFAIFEASGLRGTPGKWFFGLAVGDNEGDQLGLIHTTLRAAAKLLSLPVMVPIALLTLFSSRNQTLYDRLLGTMVVSREEEEPWAEEGAVDAPPPKREAPPLFDGLIEDWPGPDRV